MVVINEEWRILLQMLYPSNMIGSGLFQPILIFKISKSGRANGKTMKAILLSVERQIPIVCWNYEHKKDIEHRAYKMGVISKMPEPILATETRKKVIGNRKGLIVDDLDILLRRILDDNVYYATMEDCNIEKLRRSDTCKRHKQ